MMIATTGETAVRSAVGAPSERPASSADQSHLAGALNAAAAARAAAARIRAGQRGFDPPSPARPAERPQRVERPAPRVQPEPSVRPVADDRPAPRGLSVAEAARASRIAFRPLRRGHGALPYRTDYRALPSPRRPVESAAWIGAGPAPDPNDYWPMVRDRLALRPASVAPSAAAPSRPATLENTPPILKRSLAAIAAPVVQSAPPTAPGKVASTGPSAPRIAAAATTATPAEQRERLCFARTIAELERLRAAAKRPSTSTKPFDAKGARNPGQARASS